MYRIHSCNLHRYDSKCKLSHKQCSDMIFYHISFHLNFCIYSSTQIWRELVNYRESVPNIPSAKRDTSLFMHVCKSVF